MLAPALSYKLRVSDEELQAWKEIVSAPIFHYGFGAEIPLDYGYHQDGLRYIAAPPPPAPMLIIHGEDDDVIPIGRSRQYTDRYPELVQLIAVDDNHLLRNRLKLIWNHTRSFLKLG